MRRPPPRSTRTATLVPDTTLFRSPLSTCMAVLGGAWTPNVIWNLSGGPRRFSELRHDIPKVSAKVLTARLRALEAKGVVIREVKPTSPPSVEYSLTDLEIGRASCRERVCQYV